MLAAVMVSLLCSGAVRARFANRLYRPLKGLRIVYLVIVGGWMSVEASFMRNIRSESGDYRSMAIAAFTGFIIAGISDH
jgi:hypothetical protein